MQKEASQSIPGTAKRAANLFILTAAVAVGGASVWFWNGAVARAEEKAIEANLMKGIQEPVIDVHTIGIHGAFIDHHHHDDEAVDPIEAKALADADAKATAVFSTPGGAYTKDDILKNGSIQPYERFHRVQFLYSMKAFPGEPIDPITKTKTHGSFDWYVGGNLYHFSCIPSLEEFVIRAKKDPKSVLPPSRFVQGPVRVASR